MLQAVAWDQNNRSFSQISKFSCMLNVCVLRYEDDREIHTIGLAQFGLVVNLHISKRYPSQS